MNSGIDVSGFISYRNQLQSLTDKIDDIFIQALYEIAQRELRIAKKNTPVGDYPEGSGKVGGTLRRGWAITDITKTEDGYLIKVKNDVDYASYVEFGHRTRDHAKWVDGYFMMTIAESKVKAKIDEIVERHIQEAFKNL